MRCGQLRRTLNNVLKESAVLAPEARGDCWEGAHLRTRAFFLGAQELMKPADENYSQITIKNPFGFIDDSDTFSPSRPYGEHI